MAACDPAQARAAPQEQSGGTRAIWRAPCPARRPRWLPEAAAPAPPVLSSACVGAASPPPKNRCPDVHKLQNSTPAWSPRVSPSHVQELQKHLPFQKNSQMGWGGHIPGVRWMPRNTCACSTTAQLAASRYRQWAVLTSIRAAVLQLHTFNKHRSQAGIHRDDCQGGKKPANSCAGFDHKVV